MPFSSLPSPFLCDILRVREHDTSEVRGAAQCYLAFAVYTAGAVKGGREVSFPPL